jgi:hypothetical protein
MIIVNYTKSGIAISDFDAENFAKELLVSKTKYFEISSELVILAIRTLIYERYLSIENIEIQHNGKTVSIDKNGRIENNPNGFCHHFDDYLDRLLDL